MAGHSKWANIQHRKGRQDKIRAKLFSKISKEITVAAKMVDPDPAKMITIVNDLAIDKSGVSLRDKLSAEDQEVVRQAARDSVPVMRELWIAREKDSEAKVREAGVEIITDIDKTPFMEAMGPVYEKYVTSPVLIQMVADIQATE